MMSKYKSYRLVEKMELPANPANPDGRRIEVRQGNAFVNKHDHSVRCDTIVLMNGELRWQKELLLPDNPGLNKSYIYDSIDGLMLLNRTPDTIKDPADPHYKPAGQLFANKHFELSDIHEIQQLHMLFSSASEKVRDDMQAVQAAEVMKIQRDAQETAEPADEVVDVNLKTQNEIKMILYEAGLHTEKPDRPSEPNREEEDER